MLRPSSTWKARAGIDGRAKGFSKSRDVAGLSLVTLLTQFPAGAQGYIAASDAEQAGLLRQSMAEFVNSTPELQDRVKVDQRKVSAPSGAELTVLAADSAGAHGLRPYWLVVDELANFPDTPRHHDFFSALWAGLPKVADGRWNLSHHRRGTFSLQQANLRHRQDRKLVEVLGPTRPTPLGRSWRGCS